MSESDTRGRWHKLDNTANLFPVITSKRFSNVYRLSVTLHEPVVPELLQRALEKALPWFAAFKVRLRRGLFWHYLEVNEEEAPRVFEEDDYPCRFIDPRQNNGYLFQFSYFDNRINIEVFHVLSDGSGGRDFLFAVVCQYLLMAHPANFTPQQHATKWYAGHAADTEDGYLENYTPTKKNSFRIGRGYKLHGESNLLGNLSVVHLHMAIPSLKAYCKAHGVSMTQYLTAVVGYSIYQKQQKGRGAKNPVNVFMPVNLRSMFDSETSLNFFSNVYISLSFPESGISFESVLADVKKQFDEKVNKESMLANIAYTVGGGNNPIVRVAPLFLKKAVLRIIYEVSAKSGSLSLTNLGSFALDEPFASYISGATIMLSVAPGEPFKCACVSCGDTFTMTLTSTLKSVGLQRTIARHLAADGIDVTVDTNGVDYASM